MFSVQVVIAHCAVRRRSCGLDRVGPFDVMRWKLCSLKAPSSVRSLFEWTLREADVEVSLEQELLSQGADASEARFSMTMLTKHIRHSYGPTGA